MKSQALTLKDSLVKGNLTARLTMLVLLATMVFLPASAPEVSAQSQTPSWTLTGGDSMFDPAYIPAGQTANTIPVGGCRVIDFYINPMIASSTSGATATLTFTYECAAGFTCQLLMTPSTTWNLTAANSGQLIGVWLQVCNVNACVGNQDITGTFTLVTSTGNTQVVELTETITSATSNPNCIPPDTGGGGEEPGEETGCTYTQGYYKNHPDALPEEMVIGDVTYSNEELSAMLRRPTRGNGLISLERQLIAAQANIANGASASQEVLDAIAAANALIAGTTTGDDANVAYLAPSAVSDLVNILSAYNEGDEELGPGHCDDNETNARRGRR